MAKEYNVADGKGKGDEMKKDSPAAKKRKAADVAGGEINAGKRMRDVLVEEVD